MYTYTIYIIIPVSRFGYGPKLTLAYETCQLGIYTPTSLINTLWYLNTIAFRHLVMGRN